MENSGHPQASAIKHSLRLKISLAISAILLVIVAVLLLYSYHADRQTNLQQAISQVRGMNAFYFDSLNTLMLADVMEEREILRQKMLEIPGVLEVRVNRGEPIIKKFGDLAVFVD